MIKATRSPGCESDGPSLVRNPESWNGVQQANRDGDVAALPKRDGENQIQGVDIADYTKGSLDDDASESEEDGELDEAEKGGRRGEGEPALITSPTTSSWQRRKGLWSNFCPAN